MPRQRQNTKVQIVDARLIRSSTGRASHAPVSMRSPKQREVTKRTFYYHFDSKDVIYLTAVLEAQNELVLARIAAWTGKASGDPARVIEILFDELAAWAKAPSWQGSGFTRSAMELADLPGHPARAVASHHKAAVEAWLAEQLAGVPNPKLVAQQVMLLIEGCHSLMLIHGDPGYAKAASNAALHLIGRLIACQPPSEGA